MQRAVDVPMKPSSANGTVRQGGSTIRRGALGTMGVYERLVARRIDDDKSEVE